MEVFDLIVSMSASTIRVAAPLILAALAGLFSERAGVVNIALEGKMLGAAFAAAATAAITGSAWLALAAGIGVALALSTVHGVASITYAGNQMVSGMAINVVAAGLSAVLAHAWFRQGGRTPLLPDAARFGPVELPLAATLKPVPILGPLYADVLGGHNILVYVTFAAIPLVAYVVAKTRFGLRLRAVGQNPSAVDTAGISVERTRYAALAVTGLLTGIAGTYLSIAHGAGFQPDMTAGKGFLALAALIFGKWKPWPAVWACLLFAFTDALQIRLQGVALPIVGVVPIQAIQALPYILTVLLLAGFVGKAVAPKAIGIPYLKEKR
ncbi:MAG: ABC transporter permease [Alphaproteobacteria bacterium]|nr:ABC transporter permease [Alphaproteobacteria bacterium]